MDAGKGKRNYYVDTIVDALDRMKSAPEAIRKQLARLAEERDTARAWMCAIASLCSGGDDEAEDEARERGDGGARGLPPLDAGRI
jgi:hypothetical protein